MNIFFLLPTFVALGCGLAGLVCLIICLVKRHWKGAIWTLGITGAAVGSMLGLMFLFYLGWQAPSLDRPVTPSEVVGTWQLRDASIAMVKKSSDEYKPGSETIYEIELKADGSCRYRSLLEWPARYVDCPGRWKITPGTNQSSTSQLNLDLEDGGSFHLDFGEEDGPFFIWIYWGDPDSGELLIYDRKPGAGESRSPGQVFREETKNAKDRLIFCIVLRSFESFARHLDRQESALAPRVASLA